MKQSRIFEVYEEKGKRHNKLYTINLIPGKKVYDEKFVNVDGIEYREWDAWKSKLCACILRGTQNIHIKKGDVVLYLGAASGTTVSHVSDIVGKNGFVFAVDFAPRVIRDLIFVVEERKNIAPILADANRPDKFKDRVSEVDVLYQDIAQKNQVEIFLKNCNLFLKKGGFGLLAIKARSIDVTKKPKQIFNNVRRDLEEKLIIVDYRTLEPFQRDHCFFICKKK
jgi:fibrillarin-like pre-rRNA processing protein